MSSTKLLKSSADTINHRVFKKVCKQPGISKSDLIEFFEVAGLQPEQVTRAIAHLGGKHLIYTKGRIGHLSLYPVLQVKAAKSDEENELRADIERPNHRDQAKSLSDDYELHLLPDSMQWMEREIGLPAVLAIIKRHGGIAPLYIPTIFDPDHYLVRLIGAEATIKLIAKYGGDTLDIPVCRRAMLEATYQKIKRESLDTTSEQLVIKYGYTLRHIRNITKGVVDDRQGEMF